MRPWNQTLSQQIYSYESPLLGSISLHDIAHSLALINRFNGHTVRPISVAEHSIGVALMVPAEHRLGALLHDAAEAFVGDMAAPLKKLCPGFVEIEELAHKAVAERFGLSGAALQTPEIRQADLDALVTECDVLKGGEIIPWGAPGNFNHKYAMSLRGRFRETWQAFRDQWLYQVSTELRARKRDGFGSGSRGNEGTNDER